ncbi:diacylglycerol acyltransferase [Cokeromyces recurvatus]|uniref:diacylglycerol acyltransferase n=1 Tax=Cokeromyces recurvatus TaxID=90255 RepID=UPI00221EE8BB|nr:diacylglycerol acyltransferase [Cokeromyces recurvatus]KAI7904288.1 diacylglycerol acyltransferase [Cokeromyces recurvatus]
MQSETLITPPIQESNNNLPHHVRWAPLRGIPAKRRLQMLAVCIWISLVFISVASFLFLATYKLLWPILIAYITFICIDKAPESGGRLVERTRHWTIWNYFADYFPVKLIKEYDLDPTKNYVFGYHPHGIISMGAFANFATEATGFSKLFPGIKPSLLTLTSNFNIPIYRDLIMSLGLAAVSRRSCESILSSSPGRSIVIVIGGAAESLSARPGIANLVLRKRLGFIRLAIKHKAPLVPVFSFGENELYDQLENNKESKVFKYQKMMQSLLGFTLPLFHARGIFNYDIGIIPFRHEIATVVGKPIPVPELKENQKEPTEEQILQVQKQYIKELESIYNKYKDIYAKDRKQELCIID